MDIKQIEIEIRDLQGDMKISFRRTVDDAIRIGELLTDAKKQLSHGDFMPWCERQGFKKDNTARYLNLVEYNDKIRNVRNLSEAYKLIESEENHKKQLEFQQQSKRINEYKKTGKKPDDWNKATDDYRLRKEKEDAEYKERKRKAFEEKQEKTESKSQYIDTDSLLEQALEYTSEKQKLLSKMRLSGDNASEPIYDALLEYLMALHEPQRLEACHNIIKFCKGIATECQKNSIQ